MTVGIEINTQLYLGWGDWVQIQPPTLINFNCPYWCVFSLRSLKLSVFWQKLATVAVRSKWVTRAKTAVVTNTTTPTTTTISVSAPDVTPAPEVMTNHASIQMSIPPEETTMPASLKSLPHIRWATISSQALRFQEQQQRCSAIKFRRTTPEVRVILNLICFVVIICSFINVYIVHSDRFLIHWEQKKANLFALSYPPSALPSTILSRSARTFARWLTLADEKRTCDADDLLAWWLRWVCEHLLVYNDRSEHLHARMVQCPPNIQFCGVDFILLFLVY